MNNLKNLRKENNLTLKELSNLTNISVAYLSRLETGSKNNPSYIIMKTLAIVFNKNISDIFS